MKKFLLILLLIFLIPLSACGRVKYEFKDGKLLYESNNGEWKFFDRDGKEIMSNFDNITDIKKID